MSDRYQQRLDWNGRTRLVRVNHAGRELLDDEDELGSPIAIDPYRGVEAWDRPPRRKDSDE